jgi:hypothetical protein
MAERRVRTWYVVRRRYRRAAGIAAVVGVLLALVPVVQTARSDDPSALYTASFLAGSVALLVIGAVVPWLIVMALWRRTRNRHASEWY